MAVWPIKEIITTLKDGFSRAYRVKGEVDITGVNMTEGQAIPVKTGGYTEHRGLSTDTKPQSDNKTGDVFFEIDTTDAYMWDGTDWRLV